MGIKSVLFVCTGNSCRSVMAEGLLKKRLKELGKEGITVRSAGVRAVTGLPPMNETVEVLKEEGIDIGGFKTAGITDELIRVSDIILVMSAAHKDDIVKRSPIAAPKTFLLKEYGKTKTGLKEADPDIPDPIGLSAAGYKACFDIIKEEIERVARAL